MSNTILTPTMVTRKALAILHSKLNFIGSINRQYDDSYAKTGAKIGSTLKVRLPNEYTVRKNATLAAQDTTESSVNLVMANQWGVDISFSSAELTLDLDDFAARVLEPAMAVLASNIEAEAIKMYADVWNTVNTAGTDHPKNLSDWLAARRRLNECLAPKDGNRFFALNSAAMAAIVDALKGLWNPQAAISDQFRDGVMGKAIGFTWLENDLILRHTTGSRDNTTPVTDGEQPDGSTLKLKAFDNDATVKKGDVFTIADVFAVHPETKQSLGYLQQFTVTADHATAAGAGTMAAMPISPALVSSGAKQNISNKPAAGKAIVFVGDASSQYAQNLAYHRDAFAFVTADLEMPKGVDFAAREVYDGISMRIVRQYSISNDTFPCRIDVLFGCKAIRPQLACRVQGKKNE